MVVNRKHSSRTASNCNQFTRGSAQLCAALSLEAVATMVSYQLLLTREGFGKQQTIPKTDKVLNHVRDIGSADTPISALLSSPAKTRLEDTYMYVLANN